MRKKRLIIRRVALHIETNDFLAPGNDDVRRGTSQCQRILRALLLFARIDDCVGRDLVLLKEPLSLLAARSAFAVIEPVDG